VLAGSDKYTGITSAANGKLYCAPRNATQVLEIDPLTGTTELIGSVFTGLVKYFGITSGANGNLYCAPHVATQVLEINSVGSFNSFSEFFGFDEFGAPSTIYMNTL
jgi:streptogramin lyase